MELKPEQQAELKMVEIAALREFVNVCQQLNLQYYLLGGTLLGAVRHQGFIPWDDDIDVGMPRKDYETFLERGQKLLPNYLFIQTTRTDPEYLHCFAKIRNCNTTFIESSSYKHNINHGVFIDVFPLDFYPDSFKQRRIFDLKKKCYSRRINMEFSTKKAITVKRLSARVLLRILFPSVGPVLEKREKLYRSVDTSGWVANHGGAWGKKEIVPACWYGEGKKVMFEGLEVNAPAEYDQWLSQVYGDYMQLPPVEKRISHHYTEVIDLKKPYTEYVRLK